MRVIIFRHADAGEFFHAPGQKDPDPGLSAEGREVTLAMAEHLKEQGETPTAVYTSFLARSRQTGKIISGVFGLGPVKQESGFGPVDHRGPTLGVVLKTLAAKTDPKIKKIIVVSHHDNIRQGLAALNFSSEDDVDPIAKSEYRILDVDRDDGAWEEESRCLPSDIGFPDTY